MSLDPLTTAGFDAIDAGGNEEKNIPPLGRLGELRIVSTKLGTKDDGDQYAVIEYRDGDYFWSDFKWIKKNGAISEGGVKSLKILLSQLGVPNVTGATLKPVLDSLEGKTFSYEQVAAKQINPATNQPYVNTHFLGETNGTASVPAQPVAQAAPPVAQPPAAQPLAQGATFPGAPQVQAPQPASAITGV